VGAASRRKGATFERETSKLMRGITGVKYGRTTPGIEQPWGDIKPMGTVLAPYDGLFIECKAHSSVSPGHLLKPNLQLKQWWEIAYEQAYRVDRMPMLFVRFKNWGTSLICEGARFAEFWTDYEGHISWTPELACFDAPAPVAVDAHAWAWSIIKDREPEPEDDDE